MENKQVVRWGILGAGNIAHRFAQSLANEPHSQLVAISCRSSKKAAAFAEEFGVDSSRAYADDRDGSQAHEALLADSGVDAIYLALPHVVHAKWAVAALRAGKAVLSEKPATLNGSEMRQIAKVAQETNTLYMEGMKTRFVPLYRRIRQEVAEGLIGEVTTVRASLCNDMAEQIEANGSYHVRHDGGGGVLLDCGCYCATWLEDYLPGELFVRQVRGQLKDEIDYYIDADLSIGGRQAGLECAFDRKKPRQVIINGELGSIVVDELHRPQEATIVMRGMEPVTVSATYVVDDFYGEIEHFVGLMLDGKTESNVMPLSASVRQAELLDAIRNKLGYDEGALRELEAQEKVLRYPNGFGSREALELGNAVAAIAPDYDRGVSVEIVRESDGLQLFSWSTDDKAPRNYGFADGKRRGSLSCGHASLWGYVRRTLDGIVPANIDKDSGALYAGGAFPIRDSSGERVATIALSGLHEGRDHDVVTRALGNVLGVDVPVFSYLAV